MQITRDNIDRLLDARAIQVKMRSGAWWTIRRNGRTRVWKRDASRIALPFKAGMYCYGTITETDFDGDVLHGWDYRVDPTSHAYDHAMVEELYRELTTA